MSAGKISGISTLALLGAPALILPLIIVMSPVPKKDVDLCSTGAAAISVDPGSTPAGLVAGYSGEQLVNAAHIMKAAKALGLSVRDQQIGVMTAMGESGLRVLDRGDAVGPDSRGLFQQRDNGAWGSYSDRMDPFISATNFFKVLATVGERENMAPTIVANRVQRNADPYHYQPYWDSAVEVVQALAGVQPTTAPTTPKSTVGTYNLGAVKPQTRALADHVGPKFGVKEIGGVRQDPLPDHPSGLALDFMTDKAKGDAIAKYLVANAQQLGVKYLIWYQQIWNIERADEGWRRMPDRGGITANHMDHVHVTMRANVAVTGTGQTAALVDVAPSDLCRSPADGAAVPSSSGWTTPAAGPLTTPFGWRIHPIKGTRSFHHGVDVGAPCGAPIRAATDGVVVSADPSEPYGRWLQIEHEGGQISRYGHMYDAGVLVHTGDSVKSGQVVAKVGNAGWSTGCHLHFEINTGGSDVDPVGFFAKHGAPFGGASQ